MHTIYLTLITSTRQALFAQFAGQVSAPSQLESIVQTSTFDWSALGPDKCPRVGAFDLARNDIQTCQRTFRLRFAKLLCVGGCRVGSGTSALSAALHPQECTHVRVERLARHSGFSAKIRVVLSN